MGEEADQPDPSVPIPDDDDNGATAVIDAAHGLSDIDRTGADDTDEGDTRVAAAQGTLSGAPDTDEGDTRVAPAQGTLSGAASFGETATADVEPPRGGVDVFSGDTLSQRFELGQELGRGGMSKVFRARDLVKVRAGDPDTHVAIKVLTGDFDARPDSWIALQREVSRVQKLAHPHIATIYDCDTDPRSGVFYAHMEVLEGEPLEDFIDRHPQGIGDYARFERIIQGIADGLEYAHKRDIVHADLKPSNVFITEQGEAKILDFGISRVVHGDAGDFFEKSGLNASTPRYASVEMLQGSPAQPADDIFALGIIAIELATGKHPFIDSRDAIISIHTALDARDAPTPIRIRRPALIRSRRQWRAISASLQYARDDRPQDGARFVQRFRRRSKVTVASIAASLALVAAMGIWTTFFRAPQPEIPFEELPAETRAQVRSALKEAVQAMSFNDTNSALMMYNRAFELHPYNRDAMDGLDKILERFFDTPEPADAAGRRERLRQVDIFLQYEALSESRKLHRYRRKLQEAP